jgi:hypothetical protein
MCHLRNQFVEVTEWLMYIDDMSPVSFLYALIQSLPMTFLDRIKIISLRIKMSGVVI